MVLASKGGGAVADTGMLYWYWYLDAGEDVDDDDGGGDDDGKRKRWVELS